MPITDDGFEIDPAAPTVLLLGGDTEGVLSSLRTANRQYVIRRLESNPPNWERIAGLFDTLPVKAVVVKLSYRAYRNLEREEYRHIGERLFRRIASVSHLVLILEINLADESPDDVIYDPATKSTRDTGWQARRHRINEFLRGLGLSVVPYMRSSEVTVLATAFLADVEDGLLFRLYIPSHQLWSEQTEKLLQLFRDYLHRIGHRNIRLDQRRTARGAVYEFFNTTDASGGSGLASLETEFREFSHLLDLCMSDPDGAAALLRERSVNPSEVMGVLARYAKEVRRLYTDVRQEREQRMLSIRHRLESELFDTMPASVDINTIMAIVDGVVPQPTALTSLVAAGERQLLLAAGPGASITVNVRPQIIEAVNSIVAQEIRGGVSLNEHDQALLQLIAEHGGLRSMELTSAVHELTDEATPNAQKVSAKQRLLGFVYQLGGKLPDVGVGVLVEYLSKQFLG